MSTVADPVYFRPDLANQNFKNRIRDPTYNQTYNLLFLSIRFLQIFFMGIFLPEEMIKFTWKLEKAQIFFI